MKSSLSLALVGLALSSSYVWAKCDVNQRASFFNNDITVNIPLEIDGKPVCYHQKNSLEVVTEKVKEGVSVDYEISPLSASFENVPSPAVYQYLNIEYNPDNRASKVQLMSFLCSGETPIGGEAFSDSLENLTKEIRETSGGVRIFIATGQAAENISISQDKKTQSKVYDHFLEIFESRNGEFSSIEYDQSNIYIPNILAGVTIDDVTTIERKLYSIFFTKTNSSINGCSKKFRAKMQDLLLENVVETQPFKDIEIKKKKFSSKYRMRWTL